MFFSLDVAFEDGSGVCTTPAHTTQVTCQQPKRCVVADATLAPNHQPISFVVPPPPPPQENPLWAVNACPSSSLSVHTLQHNRYTPSYSRPCLAPFSGGRRGAQCTTQAEVPPGDTRTQRDSSIPKINRVTYSQAAVCKVMPHHCHCCFDGQLGQLQPRLCVCSFHTLAHTNTRVFDPPSPPIFLYRKCRVVKEVAHSFYTGDNLRWQANAVLALQEVRDVLDSPLGSLIFFLVSKRFLFSCELHCVHVPCTCVVHVSTVYVNLENCGLSYEFGVGGKSMSSVFHNVNANPALISHALNLSRLRNIRKSTRTHFVSLCGLIYLVQLLQDKSCNDSPILSMLA